MDGRGEFRQKPTESTEDTERNVGAQCERGYIFISTFITSGGSISSGG